MATPGLRSSHLKKLAKAIGSPVNDPDVVAKDEES